MDEGRREMKPRRKKKTEPLFHTDGDIEFGAENPCVYVGCFAEPAVVKFTVTLRCYAPNTEYSVDGTFSKQMYKALESAMKGAARRAKRKGGGR